MLKLYESWFGFLMVFSDECIHPDRISKQLSSFNPIGTRIVLVGSAASEYVLSRIDEYHFPQKLEITLIECSNSGAATMALQLKKAGKVNKLTIPVNEVYSYLFCDDVIAGAEIWYFNDRPDAVRELDTSVANIAKIQPLLQIADSVVDEIIRNKPRNELEKILLTDMWLQKNVQYATGRVSNASGKKYVCEELTRESCAEDVLLNHFGRCEDIAFTAALILNHPKLGVKCRQISVQNDPTINHSWNIVECNGVEYYCDFTHNITRNPNKVPGALKAKKYTCQYTLVGYDEFADRCGLSEVYSSSNISEVSYSRDLINNSIEYLMKNGAEISWGDELPFSSHLALEE